MIQNCIREILTERRINVQEFSKIIHIPESTIYRWLKDPLQIPSSEHLHYICLVMEVELGQVLVNIPCDLDDYDPETVSEETWGKFAAYRARNVIRKREKRAESDRELYTPIKNPRIYPNIDIYKLAARMD